MHRPAMTGVVWVTALLIRLAWAHELCLDTSGPVPTSSAVPQGICAQLGYTKTCCTTAQAVSQLESVLDALELHAEDPEQEDRCYQHLVKIVCSRCDGWAAHLFQIDGTSPVRDVPFLCEDYCSEVYSACKGVNITSSASSTIFSDQQSFSMAQSYKSSAEFCSDFILGNVSSDSSYFCYSGVEFVPDAPEDDGDSQNSVDNLCLQPVFGPSDSSIYIFVESVPGNSSVMLLGKRIGTIQILKRNDVTDSYENIGTWLDIQDRVYENWERGLLGFAFHPSKNLFYVSYSCLNSKCTVSCGSIQGCHVIPNSQCTTGNTCSGHDHVSAIDEYSYALKEDGTVDVQFLRPVFRLAQPWGNHNGGQILFETGVNNPKLFLMFGDGGGGGDGLNSGQNSNSYLGKILRIDVDATTDEGKLYSVPDDNPFVSDAAAALGFLPEIYAYGLRNPWRCSFDRTRPTYFVCGDVGQGRREELSMITKGGNFGWKRFEGTFEELNNPLLTKAPEQVEAVAIPPILEYSHSINRAGGHSICGGYFLRSPDAGSQYGAYIYADYRGPLFVARETFTGSGAFATERVGWDCSNSSTLDCPAHTGMIYSFGEDSSGRVFLLCDSGILQIVNQNKCSFESTNENAGPTPAPTASTEDPGPSTEDPTTTVSRNASMANILVPVVLIGALVASAAVILLVRYQANKAKYVRQHE